MCIRDRDITFRFHSFFFLLAFLSYPDYLLIAGCTLDAQSLYTLLDGIENLSLIHILMNEVMTADIVNLSFLQELVQCRL